MNQKRICLAIDLGASSGRVVAGIYDGNRLELDEINRFSNEPVEGLDGWHWNLEGLFQHITQGIGIAVRKYGDSVVSVGADAWGVDYGLLDANGKLICAPFQYRDKRTQGMQEKAFQRMPQSEIYQRTGIHSMFYNTLFQLLAENHYSDRLEKAAQMLFMPDLVHYLFTDTCLIEKTVASTSQLFNSQTQLWEVDLIKAMGLPTRIFGNLVNAGTVLGELKHCVNKEIGSNKIKVITPAGHDTAAAVAGIPADISEPAFISSGTWSLMGRELNVPVISEESFQEGFSNEGGVFGTTRFLKSIAGMWLLQECKRAWDLKGKPINYADLIAQAEVLPPFKTIIDPDAKDFRSPADMPDAIAAFSHRTRQITPRTFGEFTRTILESLALKYRQVKEALTRITRKPIDKIYVVGGGSHNNSLNQFTADALNCTVVAGPVEATSIGNIIMQLYALGAIRSLSEGRALIKRSFEPTIFEPQTPHLWDDAYNKFLKNLS